MLSHFSEPYMRMRRLLAESRRAAGMTQAEVAARLGTSQSFVSKYERGERRLDAIELLQVSRVLGFDVGESLNRAWLGEELDAGDDILARWSVSAKDLTTLTDENPSLRGMLLGYVAEHKLRQIWFSDEDISYLGKSDDHDRTSKGDHVIEYKGRRFTVESKSLQSNKVERDGNAWRGKAQVDASDRRPIDLSDGSQVNTTLLKVGEFDVLAVNCFAFRQKWDFVFAKNADLPRSSYARYPARVRAQLIASLVDVSWPPKPPFTGDLREILDRLIADRGARRA